MNSIALIDFKQGRKNVAGDVNELTQVEQSERLQRPRHWAALILPFLALLLWVLAGSFITWLVADFDRTLAPARSSISPWLIFSLCLAPAVVAGWLFVGSWKRSHCRSSINE